MTAFMSHLLRFFLPWVCAGCRVPLASLSDEGYCAICWLQLPRITGLACRICGLPLREGGDRCVTCLRTSVPLLIRAAARFEGGLARGVHRFKYAGRASLGPVFARLMASAWDRCPELHDVRYLVPVPMHPRQQRRRGYNQAELLANALGTILDRPVIPLLARKSAGPSQTRLSREERATNVRYAFRISPDLRPYMEGLKPYPFLLIDDVCTTTQTLAACARTLRRAGCRGGRALVLARDL